MAWLLEVLLYPYLALRLMGLGGPDRKPSAILPEKNVCALYRKLAKPMARPYR
jgi:hypothetical protein